MADDKGKALAPTLPPSPPAHDEERPRPLPKCVACGAVHGGVGAGVLCLENEVRRLRAVIRKFAPGGQS